MEAKKKKKLIIWGIIVAVLIIVVVAMMALKKGKPHGMTLNTERAKIDSIEVTVTATGEIQPVYKVDVGTQVSGKVEKLYVDFNSEVKKGDLLAELDRSTLSEQVQQAEAQLSNAQSNLTLAQRTYDRTKALFDNKAATQEALDAAVIEERTVQETYRVTFEYVKMNDIMQILKDPEVQVLDRQSYMQCIYTISVRQRESDRITEALKKVPMTTVEPL